MLSWKNLAEPTWNKSHRRPNKAEQGTGLDDTARGLKGEREGLHKCPTNRFRPEKRIIIRCGDRDGLFTYPRADFHKGARGFKLKCCLRRYLNLAGPRHSLSLAFPISGERKPPMPRETRSCLLIDNDFLSHGQRFFARDNERVLAKLRGKCTRGDCNRDILVMQIRYKEFDESLKDTTSIRAFVDPRFAYYRDD